MKVPTVFQKITSTIFYTEKTEQQPKSAKSSPSFKPKNLFQQPIDPNLTAFYKAIDISA